MTATVAGIHLTGIHSARPAGNAQPDGSLYSCTTHSLIYQSNYAGNSWSTWATLGGSGLSDQGVITYLDGTVAAAPGTPAAGKLRIYAKTGNVLAVKDDAGVETVLGAGGGGSGRRPLDSYSLDGTYGDDFAAASLSGIWTRRNFASGAETYQYGPGATYMQIAMTGRAAGDGYFQAAPSGDWTFMMSAVHHFWNVNMWSLCVVNTVGTGLGTMFASSANCFATGSITTYTSYGGAFQQLPTFADIEYSRAQRKTWQYLRKSGTNYYAAFSFDGEVWSPETPAMSNALTVDRVGMIVHPLSGITTTAYTAVDVFNKIA